MQFKISLPRPYEPEMWHYEQANVDYIKKAVGFFPREKGFSNLNMNNIFFEFNITVKNITSNYITHETVTSD